MVPVSYGRSAVAFDGERVVVDVISWDGACAGRLLRTFTPRVEGTDLVSEERCAPADERHEGSGARDRIAKTLGAFDSALVERDGKVFVDRPYAAGGRAQLDCLDAGTGRVLWSYAFPRRPTRPSSRRGEACSPPPWRWPRVTKALDRFASTALRSAHLRSAQP